MIHFVQKSEHSWIAKTSYHNVEAALHDLQWGTIPHPVNLVIMSNGVSTEHLTETEFRSRYLPPARG